MRPVVQEIVIDCAEPAALAAFWARLLGSRWVLQHPGWAVVDADPVLIAFQQVPEPKTSPKNRLHLDVQVDDAAAWTERAVAAGARRLSEPELGPDGDGYVVLADPEGNELCLVVDNGGRWRAAARAALDAAPAPVPL
jgi:predicted enzyme related to lactoylglutathione lyase